MSVSLSVGPPDFPPTRLASALAFAGGDRGGRSSLPARLAERSSQAASQTRADDSAPTQLLS